MWKQKKYIIGLVLAIGLITSPIYASAAGLVPCGGATESPCTVQDFFYLVARTTNYLIAMAGIYAVYRFIQAAWSFTTTMGNEEAITRWRESIQGAVLGFALVMLAYVFTNFLVNYALLRGYSECQIDLRNPLKYVNFGYSEYSACKNLHNECVKSGFNPAICGKAKK